MSKQESPINSAGHLAADSRNSQNVEQYRTATEGVVNHLNRARLQPSSRTLGGVVDDLNEGCANGCKTTTIGCGVLVAGGAVLGAGIMLGLNIAAGSDKEAQNSFTATNDALNGNNTLQLTPTQIDNLLVTPGVTQVAQLFTATPGPTSTLTVTPFPTPTIDYLTPAGLTLTPFSPEPIDPTLEAIRNGSRDTLVCGTTAIKDSVLPCGINSGAGWTSGQAVRWGIRIFNGTAESGLINEDVSQRFANARRYTQEYVSGLGLGLMGTIDMNTLTPNHFTNGESATIKVAGVDFETTDANYFEAHGNDINGKVLTYQFFEVYRPKSDRFTQIAIADPNTPDDERADYESYISRLDLTPETKLLVIRVIEGGGADGRHRMDVMERYDCGNLSARALPRPVIKSRAPLVPSPTPRQEQPQPKQPVFTQPAPPEVNIPKVEEKSPPGKEVEINGQNDPQDRQGDASQMGAGGTQPNGSPVPPVGSGR